MGDRKIFSAVAGFPQVPACTHLASACIRRETPPPLAGYEYRHAKGASAPSETAWQSIGTGPTATVGSLTNGTEYAFEVRAVSAAGEGDPATATAHATFEIFGMSQSTQGLPWAKA